MPQTLKYIGTQQRWPELAITGKQSTWVPGQQEERTSAECAQLLATGMFTLLSQPIAGATDSSGNVTGLVGPDGGVVSLQPTKRPKMIIKRMIDQVGVTFANSGTAATPTVDAASPFGSAAIKLALPSGNTWAEIQFNNSTFSKFDDHVVWRVWFEDASKITQCQVFAGTAGYSRFYQRNYLVSSSNTNQFNGEHFIGVGPMFAAGGNTFVTGVDTLADSKIRFFYNGAGATVNVWVERIVLHGNSDARVIFTFDDAVLSHYTRGFPTLAAKGIKGAFGINTGDVGTNPALYLTAPQITEMADAGQEIYSHNVTNTNYPTQSAATYTAAFKTGLNGLLAITPKVSSIYHPWVQGGNGIDVHATMRAAGVQIMRGINNATDGPHNLFADGVGSRTSVIRANQTDNRTYASLKADIDNCIKYGSTMFLMVHELVESVVLTGVETNYEVFQQLVDYCAVNRDQLAIMAMSDIYDRWREDGYINDSGQQGQVASSVSRPKDRIVNGALVCDWSASGALSTTGSTGTGFAFATDSTVQINGNPAIKCTFPSDASAQTFIGIWTPTNPIRLRDVQVIHVPVIYTSSNAAGGVGNPFQVWLNTSSGKSIRLQMTWANGTTIPASGSPGVVHTFSFARGAGAITGTGTMADLDTANETITSVRIVQATTGATANANPVWVGEIRADAKRYPGRVSIVMDGEYSSQHSIIAPMLLAKGLKASFAITNADIGLGGRMTASQLDEMYARGHEMIHHTFDSTKTTGYVNSTDWPSALSISEDVRAGFAYFKTRGWNSGIGFGVWGFNNTFESGQTQARQNLVRDALRNGGLTAVRKSTPYNGDAGKHLVPMARMPIDPLVVQGGIQITSTDTASSVNAVIDAAEATGQWAIITVHRAVADGNTPGSLEMTASNMQTWIDHLAARVAAGGVINAPFGETFSDVFGEKYA